MSTSPPTPPNPTAMAHSTPSAPQEVTVVSHSTLLYWWPVWACGFLMAIITWAEGTLMATVPPHTVADKQQIKVRDKDGKDVEEEREVLIAPKGAKLSRDVGSSKPRDPVLHMSERPALGVIFFTVVLLVIVFTNIPLRGMW